MRFSLFEQFDVLFIFAPAKKDMRHLWLSVKKHEYENKIYIDSTCNFLNITHISHLNLNTILFY